MSETEKEVFRWQAALAVLQGLVTNVGRLDEKSSSRFGIKRDLAAEAVQMADELIAQLVKAKPPGEGQ